MTKVNSGHNELNTQVNAVEPRLDEIQRVNHPDKKLFGSIS